ncbi:MAG: transporter ATP-binding protein, partial [Acidimicrobiales bacterium]|nr:transporter ATP-binding protein [Acidimicrobiales bacterium]
RSQVNERFDEIVAFAEIGDFIDTPVKFYSSGMFVRLGFAVAVAAEPDLLLVDEVLAVGDIAFQVKCFVRMRELQDAGSTIIVVSHNLSSVRNLCSRVLVLHDGRPVFLGPTDEAISVYHEVLATSHSTAPELEGAAPVELVEFALLNKEGRRTSHVESGEEISLLIRIRLRVAQEEPVFSFSIATEAGMPIYGNTNWGYFSERVSYGADQELVCRIRMPALLMTGSYTAIGNVMWDQDHEKQLSSKPLVFYVSGRNLGHGIVDLGASFEVDRSEVARPLVDDTAHDGHSQDERAVPDRTYGQSADVGEVGEEHER